MSQPAAAWLAEAETDSSCQEAAAGVSRLAAAWLAEAEADSRQEFLPVSLTGCVAGGGSFWGVKVCSRLGGVDRSMRPRFLAKAEFGSWCDSKVEGCGEEERKAGLMLLGNCATA